MISTVSVKTISVNGECLTTVPKDKTAITLRVTTLAPTAVASMQSATLQMAQITKYLETMPVQMQTTRFNSYEKTEWNRDQQKSVTLGIETTIAVEVSADNITTIEHILSQFAGNTNVYSENLRMYTSPERLQPVMEKCLSIAVENARVRADALASGDGKTAGKLLSVSYGTHTNDVTYEYKEAIRTGIIDVDKVIPDEPLTRENSAIYMIRVMRLEEVAKLEIYKSIFSDVNENVGYISILGAMGVFEGDENSLFNPKKCLTRADAMIIIYNYLSR